MKPAPERQLLWSCVRACRATVVAAMLAGAVRQFALLAIPWCLQHALDDGVTAHDTGRTLAWAGAILACGLVQFVGLVGWEWWANLADARVGQVLRARLMRRLATLDRAALVDYGHGDLATRAGRDTELVRQWIHGLPVWAVVLTTFALVLPGIATMDTGLLLVVLAMVVPLAVLNGWFPGRFGRASAALGAAHADRADAVEDLLTASAAVRGLGGEQMLVARHHERSAAVTAATVRAARYASAWTALGPAVPRLTVVAGVWVGGLAVLDGRLTVGGLVAFVTWMTTLTLALRVVVERLVNRGDAGAAASRLVEVLALLPRVTDPAQPIPLPTGPAPLTLHGVTVRHGDRDVLHNLDFTVAPGEFVAVTGPIGSGKSTLLRLLARWDDPDAGSVRYGDVDLRTAAVDQVSARIGLVPQRPVLLSGTVTENLRLGRDPAPDAEQAACVAAALDTELAALPDGHDTEIAEGGGSLSGGQRQRLALARGLVGVPSVLLLDDVSSALDPDTERRVLAAVRALHVPGTTDHPAVVWVTHREAVLAAADRVVDLAVVEAVEVACG
ncbi:ABC transporter ATP-binding protein/permease [Frankia sp. AgPm24]|uniref:ABC transporter ATP-binding protein n=1 Tax=Frankia sp. AgPm24 TaxID=631128 RepID=UPI00201003D3|nr:ABC transporter ATP-binding protein [Frankia sp. AgPm24]MCK9920717.1 ABC transporter ATP-binding protein/permease [Frankia sp. AgPm24]